MVERGLSVDQLEKLTSTPWNQPVESATSVGILNDKKHVDHDDRSYEGTLDEKSIDDYKGKLLEYQSLVPPGPVYCIGLPSSGKAAMIREIEFLSPSPSPLRSENI